MPAPGGVGWWWLLRVVVISAVGVLVASFIAASGGDYHDSRNSGLLGAPFYSLSIGLLLLVPLTTLAAVLIWKKESWKEEVVVQISETSWKCVSARLYL